MQIALNPTLTPRLTHAPTPTCARIQSKDLCVYLTLKVETNTFKARPSDANNTFKVRTFFNVSLNMTSTNKVRKWPIPALYLLQGECYPVHLVTKQGPGFCPHYVKMSSL